MISLMDIAFLALAGGVAGLLGGLLGIGGGVVMIPALFTLFDFWQVPIDQRMHIAVATSLVVIVATNMSTVRAHHKRGSVDWALARGWLPVIALGAGGGSLVAQYLRGDYLVFAFVGLVFLLAVKMILPLDHIKAGDRPPRGPTGLLPPFFFAGLSAILGIGGGSFNVPYLTLYGVAIQRAVATAALCGLIISLAGGVVFMVSAPSDPVTLAYMIGYVHLPSVIALAGASVLLAPVGAALAHRLSKRQLSTVFGIFLILAAARMLIAVLG